jgi:hypothetical protein
LKEDLTPEMLEGLTIHFVRTVEQAIEIAIGKIEKPIRPLTGGGRRGEVGPAVPPVH